MIAHCLSKRSSGVIRTRLLYEVRSHSLGTFSYGAVLLKGWTILSKKRLSLSISVLTFAAFLRLDSDIKTGTKNCKRYENSLFSLCSKMHTPCPLLWDILVRRTSDPNEAKGGSVRPPDETDQ